MHSRRINTSGPTTGSRRRGILLVLVLACVVVITVLLGTILQNSMKWRRQVRVETRQVQAQWLAESGLNRAVWKLQRDSEYQGETWTLTGADAPGGDASVDITIIKEDSSATVRSVATFAPDMGVPVRARRELTFGE